MRAVLMILAVTALGGCVHTVYYKDGATNAEFQRDMAECRMKAAVLPRTDTSNQSGMEALGTGLGTLATYEQFMRDCMLTRGYERVKK